MRNFNKCLLLISCLFLSACHEVVFGIVNLPEKFSDVSVIKDVAYGTESLQQLDIYLPRDVSEKSAKPVLVFFHGGRWTIGNKNQYQFIGYQFAERGYVTVIADHRKYPEVKHPVFVEDAAQAIAWTYNNIKDHGGNNANLFVAGHSSGAHIVALAISDPSYLSKHKLKLGIVSGYAGLAGPYDFTPKADDLKDMFGPPEKYASMKVTTYIDGTEPPMLLLYGLKDKAVDEYNIDRLAKRIKEKNGRVEVIKYDDVDHQDIMANMTWATLSEPYARNDMIKFFEKNIK